MLASLVQLLSGHNSAVTVSKYQPAKLAAFEGIYDTQTRAPMSILGWVNEKQEKVEVQLSIPGLLSWLTHGDVNKPVKGLRQFSRQDWPPVNFSFQCYHLMIFVGLAMIALAGLGFLYFWQGSLFQKRWLLKLLVLSVLGPQLANQAGWFATEVGRQPWVVYGLLRTSEGLSQTVKAGAVLSSIILFSLIYVLLFAVFIYLLNDKIKNGPDEADLSTVYQPKPPFKENAPNR
jgi:cytochrome d ubiquinol oxidase subunit I